MDYLLLKWIHILSSTILFGTGIGSAFFMFMANRRKDIASISFATRHVVIADWAFTTPSVILQLITGLMMVQVGGYKLSGQPHTLFILSNYYNVLINKENPLHPCGGGLGWGV